MEKVAIGELFDTKFLGYSSAELQDSFAFRRDFLNPWISAGEDERAAICSFMLFSFKLNLIRVFEYR